MVTWISELCWPELGNILTPFSHCIRPHFDYGNVVRVCFIRLENMQ